MSMPNPRAWSVHVLAAVALTVAAGGRAGAMEPPPESEHEFTFAVLGDSQFHLPNLFNQVIDEVVHLYPAFVIHVGDMISGYVDDPEESRAQWRRFRAQIAPLGEIPFLPVPGNHDIRDAERGPGGETIYREEWGELYYSFDYANTHFVVLYTDDCGESAIGDRQLAWLEDDLSAARTQEHVFVFSHRPLYWLENGDAMHQLFVDSGVSAVICGHLHHYNYQVRDGIPYVMAYAAAHLGTPFPLAAGSLHHILLITVRDDTFRLAVVKAGSVLPPDIVRLEDNQGLYRLERGFFSQRQAAFDRLEQRGDAYEVTLLVNNPSDQDLTIYLEWQLPNERWAVDPLKGRRLQLAAGTENHPVTFTLRRRFPHAPEAFPSCIARAHYLTSDGDVVQSEHVFEIVRELEVD